MLKSQRGFIMMELLLVLVGAVLFVNMGFSIQRSASRMQLSMSARQIQTLIRQAQDQAYGEQATHSIGFYTLSGKCIQIRKLDILREIEMPQGIKIEHTSFKRGKIHFRGKLTPSMGGTIVLSSKAHKVKITVLPVTGRVKIYPITKK